MKIWNNPRAAAESEPYLHQYYNVQALHDTSPFSRKNVLAKILNALIKKMNEMKKEDLLPRMIIIVPDGDIIHLINHYEYGVSTIIGRCLDWLINQIDRAIRAKKSALRIKRPGSVSPFEPKIVWIKMLCHPGRNPILNLREKFNNIMEQCLNENRAGYIMEPSQEILQRNLFDRGNNITHDGRVIYWRHVNKILKDFDLQDLPLEPNPTAQEGHRRHSDHHVIRHHHFNDNETHYPYRPALLRPC